MRVRRFVPFVAGIAAGLALGLMAGEAHADDNASVGVMDRPRPDYDAKGIDVGGGFRLKPAVDVNVSYDDNVFRTETPTASDTFATLRGGFDLRSNWGRHELAFSAQIVRQQYFSHQEANETDWNVGASGRLDLAHRTTASAEASYAVLHEPRSSPDEPGGALNATRYSVLHADASLVHDPGIVAFSEGGSFDRYVYEPTKLIGGGTFDNADRNHDAYQGWGKVAYQPSPNLAVFLRGSYGGQTYDHKLDRNGFDREQQSFHADAGTDVHLTHLLEGEVFVGYVNDRFHAPLQSVTGIDYGAALHWFATNLLTVHFTASRLFDDTTLDGASISDDQSLGLSADYELLRNLIIQSHVSFLDSRFVGITRNDTTWEAGIGAKWLIDRYISAGAGYTFSHRSSSAPGQNYNDNLATAGLHFQL